MSAGKTFYLFYQVICFLVYLTEVFMLFLVGRLATL